MKVSVSYKGFFLKKTVEQEEKEGYFELAKEIVNNHKSMLLNTFDDVDFYFSTYDLNRELDEIYKKEFNPKSYSYISDDYFYQETWIPQLTHYKNLISNIKEQSETYDLFIFTRPDLKFLQKFSDLNIDLSKFNIIHQHLSGNCDDNFWVFGKQYFELFETTIDNMLAMRRITHEINHELIRNGVQINYITPYDSSAEPLGHKIFEVCR